LSDQCLDLQAILDVAADQEPEVAGKREGLGERAPMLPGDAVGADLDPEVDPVFLGPGLARRPAVEIAATGRPAGSVNR
jgi:hypothetical protein